MGKGEGSRAEAEAHDLSGRAQENSGGAESPMGEGEARELRQCRSQPHDLSGKRHEEL